MVMVMPPPMAVAMPISAAVAPAVMPAPIVMPGVVRAVPVSIRTVVIGSIAIVGVVLMPVRI
jgi:hypothetical protein